MMCDDLNFDSLSVEDENPPDVVECKGIFFRYSRSSYVSSHQSVEFRESYRLLKKKSCPGCDECRYFWEELSMDDVDTFNMEWPKEPCHGDLYKVRYIAGWKDSDGDYYDWSWALDKVECRFLPVPIKGREVLSHYCANGCIGCNNCVRVGIAGYEHWAYVSCMSIEVPWECQADKNKPLSGTSWKIKYRSRKRKGLAEFSLGLSFR